MNQEEGSFQGAYLDLLASGELQRRANRALRHLEHCDLCARGCHVNRLLSTKGAACRTGRQAVVCSYGPHFGEEAPLVGSAGSGTIFFSWCNLRCVFCQNWELSQEGEGRRVGTRELADIMLELQAMGCHNINLVTPSHVVPQILDSVLMAAQDGLKLPLVYNSGGYDSPQALELMDGVVDIYMPDMKFADSQLAQKYTGVKDYWEVNRAAVLEMHRQVGDLLIDRRGVAQGGLLVRHLVLPENQAGTYEVLAFLAGEVSKATYLNLMDQYRPCYRADEYPPLDRRLSSSEFRQALKTAEGLGLTRLDRRC